MKKNLIALVIVNVATLAGISRADAQIVSGSNSLEYGRNTIEINKAVQAVRNTTSEVEMISPRALKSFADKYKNVSGESWMRTKDGFSVRFTSNNVRNTVFYDKKGFWTGSLKLYSEEKMLHEVRHAVKSTYYDYNIIYTQEVEVADSKGTPTYIVCLEDKTNIKWIRLYDGEMSVWKEFTKAN
ncbi:MAG TPA: hypothetical protein VGQ04_11765 [Chitinophagaceae bacterium]|nr:hypothetical protein [Chitinophagaceae bacterium]